jgi:hypothetical protein
MAKQYYSQKAKQKIMFLGEVYRSGEDTRQFPPKDSLPPIRDVGCDGGSVGVSE